MFSSWGSWLVPTVPPKFGGNMKAAVYTEPRKIIFDPNFPDPEMGDGVMIRVKASGVCATDIKAFKGLRFGMEPPMILGHEFAGEVIASTMDDYKIGDRISAAPYAGCGFCNFCLDDHEELCQNKVFTTNGCFAEKLFIPRDLVYKTGWKIAPDVSYQVAALAEPLACIVLSLKSCHWQPGWTIMVIGGGFMGILHVILTNAWGATKIILSEPNPQRRAFAEKMGAIVCDPSKVENLGDFARKNTDGFGPHVVIASIANEKVVESAFDCPRAGGYYHMFGGLPKQSMINIPSYLTHYKEVSLVGTSGFRTKDYRLASRLINEKKINLEPVLSSVFHLDQVGEAIEQAEQQNILKAMIVE
jgi:L-iditol 2-dehydrogenase